MIVSRKVLLQYTTLLLQCIQNLDRSKVICKRLYESLGPYIKEPVLSLEYSVIPKVLRMLTFFVLTPQLNLLIFLEKDIEYLGTIPVDS